MLHSEPLSLKPKQTKHTQKYKYGVHLFSCLVWYSHLQFPLFSKCLLDYCREIRDWLLITSIVLIVNRSSFYIESDGAISRKSRSVYHSLAKQCISKCDHKHHTRSPKGRLECPRNVCLCHILLGCNILKWMYYL